MSHGSSRHLNVTGVIVRLPLADSVKVAQTVVPGLDTIVLVGE